MLLHIALRITEKLKSAYPQSVWQWKDTPSLQDILAGGAVRILVENMNAYTGSGAPAPSNAGDGFMNVEDCGENGLPFN